MLNTRHLAMVCALLDWCARHMDARLGVKSQDVKEFQHHLDNWSHAYEAHLQNGSARRGDYRLIGYWVRMLRYAFHEEKAKMEALCGVWALLRDVDPERRSLLWLREGDHWIMELARALARWVESGRKDPGILAPFAAEWVEP